jgi:hypothetical protein
MTTTTTTVYAQFLPPSTTTPPHPTQQLDVSKEITAIKAQLLILVVVGRLDKLEKELPKRK